MSHDLVLRNNGKKTESGQSSVLSCWVIGYEKMCNNVFLLYKIANTTSDKIYSLEQKCDHINFIPILTPSLGMRYLIFQTNSWPLLATFTQFSF